MSSHQMEHLKEPRQVKGYGHTSLAEPHHSSRRPYSLLHTVADSQVRPGCQVLEKVFERVKMKVVVATFP